ncbi:MAG: hypothetical protein M1840_004649 [Geoglossum simile]|nr:MAG: hypothetical protein M1840_004649 [Geoglossum simile]
MAPTASGNSREEKRDEKTTQDSSEPASNGSALTTQPPTRNQAASLTKKRKRESKPIEEIEVDITAPEPPSKKALRRAKKGKPVASTASKSAKGGAHTPDADSEGEKRLKRSDHGIWIGNLPFTFTKADLRKFLTENSSTTEDQITRVHLPSPNGPGAASVGRKLKPQNKGFAYVDFSTESVLKEALELSETLISGRRVLIKNAKSFEGRPEKASDSASAPGFGTARSGKPPSKKIFVGNLAFDTTEEDLREHFNRCGEVKAVFVATFEDSGKCKGFAWVEFEDLEAAEAAVRGWVKVPVQEDEEEEGYAAKEDSDGEKEGERKGARMRKWWVNRIRGRALRMEFAEDKVIRYKKRYGKDGTAKVITIGRGVAVAPESTEVDRVPVTIDIPEPKKDTSGRARRSTREPRKIDARTIKPGAALANAQRMTGGIVESKGKKITFDD